MGKEYTFFELDTDTDAFYPVCPVAVPAGFPSPAEDYIEGTLSLSELLIENPASTLFAWAVGRSLEGIHIMSGDLLIIDRNRQPKDGSVIMVFIEDNWTVKILSKQGKRIALLPAAEGYPVIYPREGEQWSLLGVVTANIHDHVGRFDFYRKGGYVWAN